MSKNPYDYSTRKGIRPISWEDFYGICKALARAVYRFQPEYVAALALQDVEPDSSLLIQVSVIELAKG